MVIGGAGYVGSFTANRLAQNGFEVVVVDDLSSGYKDAIPGLRVENIDIVSESAKLTNFFQKEKFDSIVHFAALLQVAQSMQEPGLYFRHNVAGSLNVIEAAVRGKVSGFVFSSSAAVYGNPQKLPIPEEHPKNPTSVYGETKVMVEKILEWYWKIFQFPSVSIRYFNASGASKDGKIGEDHPQETHLIPKIIRAVVNSQEMTIFGKDYSTPDGTCVRDYIHVEDLTTIHIKALEYLQKHKGAFVFNAGTGKGYSNLEVVKMVEKISGKKVKFSFGERRPGDPAQLVADPSRAKQELGWQTVHSKLENIVSSAWLWHTTHKDGYKK